jgi:hypothetical protein
MALSVIVPFFVAACDQKAAKTDDEQLCIAKLYPKYDETHLDQCMTACESCRHGNTVTCSMSCKLKGAT